MSAPVAAQVDETAVPLTTDDLVRIALQNNPDLTALHAEWSATLREGDAARRSLPNPELSYTAYLLAGPQRHMVGLSQAFPWFRALRDAEDPYIEEARAIAARFDAEALEVAFEVEAAVWRLAFVDALTDLVTEQRAVYRDILEHELAVMRVGGAEHDMALRMTVMVEMLTDRLADLAAERESELAMLRALVRVPEPEPLEVSVPALPERAPQGLDTEELVARMGAWHPALEVYAARAAAAIERSEVAANGALPMPMVMIAWGVVPQDEGAMGSGPAGRDMLNVGLSVPLPVFRRQYRGAEAARVLESEALDAEAQGVRWDLAGQIARAVVRVHEEDERVGRYARDLVPAAHDATEHLAIAIAQGMVDHTAYLLALEQELQLRAMVLESRLVIAVETARLDMLTAGSLAELTDTAPRADVAIDTYGGTP